LGLDVIYIQAKKWDAAVGRPDVLKFAGALQGRRARKGIFITTGSFSKDAVNFSFKIDIRIVLIDGKKIVERGNFKYLALFIFDATMSCGCNKFRTTISIKESNYNQTELM
jgi:hypothetical protein